jgi:hypothetical protein
MMITPDISGIVLKGTWNKTDVAIKVFKLEGDVRPRESVSALS